MRTAVGRCVLSVAITMGIFAMGAASSVEAAKPVKEVAKKVVRPSKGARAKAPPKGSKVSKALAFNKTMKWKTDAKSHSVFALGANKQLWFLDPGTGWPYTIDGRGTIYTADPLTGIVYDLGRLSSWVGDALYFFGFWDFSNGSYRVPTKDVYLTIYDDPKSEVYTYDTAYTEVWEYDEYFESTEFVNETVDVEYYEDDGDEADAAEDAADDAQDAADDAEDDANEAEDAANDAADDADDAQDEAEDAQDNAEDDADDAEDAADEAADDADDAQDEAEDAQDEADDAQDEADDAQDEADDAQDDADDSQDDSSER